MNRGKYNSAQELREELESVSDDAWGMVPALPEQAQALWHAVWQETSITSLGDTIVVHPTRERLQVMAEDAGCWWRWDDLGEPWSMSLAEARIAYGSAPAVIDNATAIAVLQTLREMVDAEYWPAIDLAVARIAQS